MTARMCELCPEPAVLRGRCRRHLEMDEHVVTPKRRKPPPPRKQTAHRTDPHWTRLARSWLARHPFCESCRMQGRQLVVADCVDHVLPVELYPELMHDGGNLQSLCSRKPHSCHQRKTAWERKGVALDFARRKRHDISGRMLTRRKK